MDFNRWNPFWTACFAVMASLIIAGNSLTIATLLKKRFRKRPHFLLTSLAFADLLVGICAVPLYININLNVSPHLPSQATPIFNFFDIFTGLSSIFTLAIISLVRLHAAVLPFGHRQLSLTAHLVSMVTPWILSSVVASIRLVHSLGLTTVILISLTPLMTSCSAYFVIWLKVINVRRKLNSSIRSFKQKKEARFSKTLLLTTAASFITWMPFACSNIVFAGCSSCKKIHVGATCTIKLLQYTNSFVNFLIYFYRLPSFRRALLSTFTGSHK